MMNLDYLEVYGKHVDLETLKVLKKAKWHEFRTKYEREYKSILDLIPKLTIGTQETQDTAKELIPWRKGPFEVGDLSIEIPVRNMAFNNKPLREILKRIEYNYGVMIQLENKDLLEMKYSTALNDTTIDDFLNELKITFKVEVIQTKPSTYVLKGGDLN